MRRFFAQPLNDVMECLTQLARMPRPTLALVTMMISLVVTWFVYVPVHELLHAAGCVATGGTVSRLEIAPQYGGALLSRWFGFVVSGGDYAGRLAGFETYGNDWVYLATDFAPFVLSIVVGVPLLRSCTRRARPVRLGIATVIGLAPFYNLPGDYYEMGSIVSTRLVGAAMETREAAALHYVRSDDVFKLVSELFGRKPRGDLSAPNSLGFAGLLVLLSLLLAVLLAFITYGLGVLVHRFVARTPSTAT